MAANRLIHLVWPEMLFLFELNDIRKIDFINGILSCANFKHSGPTGYTVLEIGIQKFVYRKGYSTILILLSMYLECTSWILRVVKQNKLTKQKQTACAKLKC